MSTILTRFFLKVDKNGPVPAHRPELGPCWIWTGSKNFSGYGHMRVGDTTHTAHRISFELFVRKLEDGEQALHQCDNPPCVNPDHLFAGTHGDNMHDKAVKGRVRHGVLPVEVWSEIRKAQWARKSEAERKALSEKISASEKGKSFTPEHLENLRAAHAARRGTERSIPWNKGMAMPEETRKKVSESRKGKGGRALDPQAEVERARKISEARKKWWADRKAARQATAEPTPQEEVLHESPRIDNLIPSSS